MPPGPLRRLPWIVPGSPCDSIRLVVFTMSPPKVVTEPASADHTRHHRTGRQTEAHPQLPVAGHDVLAERFPHGKRNVCRPEMWSGRAVGRPETAI